MTSLVNTIQITAVNQPVTINVEPDSSSKLFTKHGMITIPPGNTLEVEDSRLDFQQLVTMQKLKTIRFTRNTQRVCASNGEITGTCG